MDNDDDDDVDMLEDKHLQHELGPSVLPAPIASAISLVTRSSALYLRLGAFIGGLALDGARVTTLTGLELSRAIIEGILSRAGKDVASRSLGELGKKDSEGLLERSIATLHSTITHISFAASTGFHISSTALSASGDLSQQLLTALDSVLGSTDSSRAIASIVILIRREFENPATGQPGEKVGVVDLLIGVCGLALLQRWCKRLTDLETSEKHVEDVVWDVVILNDGRRADISTSAQPQHRIDGDYVRERNGLDVKASFVTLSGNKEILHAIQHDDELSTDTTEDEWPETRLKEQIMQNLPSDANVSIKTEISTIKTITVEITGAQPADLSPPPGLEIVEENAHHENPLALSKGNLTNEEKIALLIPRYRVVYRTIKNRFRGTDITPNNDETEMVDSTEERDDHSFTLGNVVNVDKPTHDASILSQLEATTEKEAAQFALSPFPSPEPEDVDEKDHIDHDPVPHLLDSTVTDRKEDTAAVSPSANQKRPRKPMSISSTSGQETSLVVRDKSRPPLIKKLKQDSSDSIKKKGTIRNALRKGSGTALSNLWSKDPSSVPERPMGNSKTTQPKPAWSAPLSPTFPKAQKVTGPRHKSGTGPQLQVPQKGFSSSTSRSKQPSSPEQSMVPARDAPKAPQRGNPNYFSSRDLGKMTIPESARSHSRASYYSVHESRRDSVVSQTDTYSIHSGDTRPSSPNAFRSQLRAQSSLIRTKSEKNMSLNVPPSPSRGHRRARSHVPSICTLNTNTSETSLVLAPHFSKGAYDDEQALNTLSRTGHIDGLFPQHHIVRNITRFIRFASASYGSHFLRVMGITSTPGSHKLGVDQDHHYEHHSFSHHTQLPASTILLSSFVDPQGGTDSTGHTNTGVPMVHFISLDHESRAVVLTCRGTLGFEDVLTDMTCDYDDLIVRGKAYKVHKGIHASALRLLSGTGSRVIATLAAALEEFPDYGLVMCGHSLGGGVVSLLAIMISEPASSSSFSFVTTSAPYQPSSQLLLTSSNFSTSNAPRPDVRLPSGRPIHVYAYGPPATLSSSLRLKTRGLITTIINGQDLVPYLSLGVLHDCQAIALAFKTDDSGAKGEVRKRVWAGLTAGLVDKWYGGRDAASVADEDDEWAYAALKALRASMLSDKLVPPGECFVVESMPVLQRDAFVGESNGGGSSSSSSGGLGRPATRAQLRFVRDVDKRFGELTFGASMLLDHSPGRYEASLAALGKGVLG